MSGAVLRAEGLRLAIRGVPILRGVDLDARPGEVHGLIGPNGAGKSTLLRAVALLRRPDAGNVVARVDGAGRNLGTMSVRERARVVAVLPQDTGIDQDFTVRDIVALGRYAHVPRWRTPSRDDAALVEAAMNRAGIAHLADRSAQTLSGGQRQLALIAKQLAQQPRVHFFDEPVSALDLGHQLEVARLLRDLADAGAAVVVVLHDIALASRVCDVVTVLHDGLVAASGPPNHVITPRLLENVYGVRALVAPDPAIGARAVRITPLETVGKDTP